VKRTTGIAARPRLLSFNTTNGSLRPGPGRLANVSNTTFADITAVNAVYAARFKSWQGQGLAQNISWCRIRAYNVSPLCS
jgi:hypothetical protein